MEQIVIHHTIEEFKYKSSYTSLMIWGWDPSKYSAYLCKLVVIPDGIYTTTICTPSKETIEQDCKKTIPGLESLEIIKELGTPIIIF